MSRKLGLLWCLPHELTIEIVPTPVRGSRNKGENIRIFPLWILSTEAQLCLYPLTNVQTPSVREKPRCEGCALSGEKGREANITAESLLQHSRGPLSFSVRRSCSHSSQKPRLVNTQRKGLSIRGLELSRKKPTKCFLNEQMTCRLFLRSMAVSEISI